jgi:hypothetical protein
MGAIAPAPLGPRRQQALGRPRWLVAARLPQQRSRAPSTQPSPAQPSPAQPSPAQPSPAQPSRLPAAPTSFSMAAVNCSSAGGTRSAGLVGVSTVMSKQWSVPQGDGDENLGGGAQEGLA